GGPPRWAPPRRRGRHRASRGGRHPLPRLRRWRRGQRARLQPSCGSRGRGTRARYRAHSRLESVSHRARRAAGRGAGGAVVRRSGLLLQLGRRSERGRVQVRPQVVGKERNRRLQRQLPRTPVRHARRHGSPRVPEAVRAAGAGHSHRPAGGLGRRGPRGVRVPHGRPMGAVLLRDAIAGALKPGDHATTFGGGPLVASVALEVVRTIAQPDFLAAVRQKGEWLGARLARLAARSAKVNEVRGRGLMWGLELAEPAAPYVTAARERGLLVVTAGANVLRLVPPLVISSE